jgi:hypothetical protein
MIEADTKILQELAPRLLLPLQFKIIGQPLAKEMVFTIKKWGEDKVRYSRKLEVKTTKGPLGWALILVDRTKWNQGTITGERLLLRTDGRFLHAIVKGNYNISASTATMRVFELVEIDIGGAVWHFRIRQLLICVKNQIRVHKSPRWAKWMYALKKWIKEQLHSMTYGCKDPVKEEAPVPIPQMQHEEVPDIKEPPHQPGDWQFG